MTGKPTLDKILFALNLLIMGGAAFVIFQSTKVEPEIDPKKELETFHKNSIEAGKIPPYALPKLTINLLSRKTRLHYLDTQVHLVLMDEKYRKDIDNETAGHKHQIISIIIETVSALKPAQISSVSGKLLLAENIKDNINIRIGKKLIQKVLFTRFVIQ